MGIIEYLEKHDTNAVLAMLEHISKNLDQYGYVIPFIKSVLDKRGVEFPSQIRIPQKYFDIQFALDLFDSLFDAD